MDEVEAQTLRATRHDHPKDHLRSKHAEKAAMNSLDDTLYNVEITFHGAENLPVADMLTLSADPYLEATIIVPAMPRPVDDPPLRWRTPTVRRTRDPRWDARWVLGGVPASGALLEIRAFDEDLRNRDDKLGKAVMEIGEEMMRVGYESGEVKVKLEKRRGNWRPWAQTYLAATLPGQKLRKHNRVVVSVKVIGETKNQKDRRTYTLGPNVFSQHFSPVIGAMVNRKARNSKKSNTENADADSGPKISATTFVANKLQLAGPTPPELHFHFVGFNRLIVWAFASSGILGRMMNSSLRKQYRTIYSYDKATRYGVVEDLSGKGKGKEISWRAGDGDVSPPATNGRANGDAHSPSILSLSPARPNTALARQFLSMARWGGGHVIFTYVITLDAEWRFTETGDEFAIDFLSKHSMHADCAIVIAFSGEFFVRRMRGSDARPRTGSEQQEEGSSREQDRGGDKENAREDAEEDEEEEEGEEEDGEVDHDPSHYELVIDDDSGTYRPSPTRLPILHDWLSAPQRLGALGKITCAHAFDDAHHAAKETRKDAKRRAAGGQLPVRRGVGRRGSSVSSLSGVEVGAGRRGSVSSTEVRRAVEDMHRDDDADHERGKRGGVKEAVKRVVMDR